MKIAIVGYGRMGHMVEQVLTTRWHTLSVIISPETETRIGDLLESDFDVVIDFSVADVALENIRYYAEHDIRVIMGTTGWYDHLDEVKELFTHSEWALLWWGNFSLGVQLFWKMLENAAKIMNRFDTYDVFGHEFHHGQKSDSPSGTAITTGNILLEHIDRKDTLVTTALTDRKIEPGELHFSSTRGGSMPGTHSVYFDSPFDTIEITHTARTRDGFAIWAVICAEWLVDKRWYFEISDFTDSMIARV
jgi:4-hydroxy-tetrahydrodipicolinate reductase